MTYKPRMLDFHKHNLNRTEYKLSFCLLCAYLGAGLLFCMFLPSLAGRTHWPQAIGITASLMTGGDPYTFKHEVFDPPTTATNSVLAEPTGITMVAWVFAWCLHIMSYLLVPLAMAAMFSVVLVNMKERNLASLNIAYKRMVEQISRRAKTADITHNVSQDDLTHLNRIFSDTAFKESLIDDLMKEHQKQKNEHS